MSFKCLLFVFAIFGMPAIALAQHHDVGEFPVAVGAGEALSDDCSFDNIVTARRGFKTERGARDWCGGIHRLFGFDRQCFSRRANDGQWWGNFRHQRQFRGTSFAGIFDRYREWNDRHLFRGFQFQHHSQFSRQCFGRGGNGGGGYP